MSDDDATDDLAPGRPDHPARPPGDEPTPDDADERYVTGADGEDEESGAEDGVDRRGVFTRVLDAVPGWVVDLGAGCLLASTLATLIASAVGGYYLATGTYARAGIAPSRLVTWLVVTGLATVFQALAVRWARKRIRWMWVMLAASMGMLSVAGTVFALPAAGLLFLSKRHFAMSTPADLIPGGDDESGAGEAESGTGEADA